KVELPRMSRKIRRSTIFSLMASAAAILFFFLFPRFVPVGDRVLVGKLARQVDARWETASGQVAAGDDLYAGPLKLTAGFAEIELDSGVNVIVEAPAQLTLESANQLYLQQGRLVAKINKTSQNPFVVHSSHASIVDYGTEFGVQVDDRNTLTHVYQGRVELRSGSNPLRFENRMALTQNQAGLVNVQGEIVDKQDTAGLFVRQHEFEARVLAAQGAGYHRWLAYSYQLRRDPNMVAYYTFERDSSNPARLANMATATSEMLDGTLSSANKASLPTWEQGRWPQTTALRFDRAQMQMVEVPSHPALGINGPITIAAWIECVAADDGGHIVSNRVGIRSQSNYQFGYRSPVFSEWKTRMHFARKADSGDSRNQLYSKPLPEAVGWILVAATHDNDTLKFYLNGKLVDTRQWSLKQPLAEGRLQIGSDFSPDDPARFNGLISELVIARRIFTEEVITRMYEAGKP
ncbi:MAG: LamG-like jellyroll fold domain-containing protein, partial [Anaerohalosphaeraceae bacterium]